MGESADTIGKKLKTLRLKKGLKRSSVASKAGISYDYLTKIENGQRSPNIAMLERICNAVGISVEQLLTTSVELKPVRKDMKGLYPLGEGKPVPLIGWTRAGFWEEASDGALPPGAAEDWLYSELGGGRVFALRVEGDSMEPEFCEGDYILVDPERTPAPNDFVIAKLEEDNSATFKQLKHREGKTVLHPLNPAYPDIEIGESSSARIVGVVVEKKRFFGKDERSKKLAEIAKRIEQMTDSDLERLLKALDIFFAK